MIFSTQYFVFGVYFLQYTSLSIAIRNSNCPENQRRNQLTIICKSLEHTIYMFKRYLDLELLASGI